MVQYNGGLPPPLAWVAPVAPLEEPLNCNGLKKQTPCLRVKNKNVSTSFTRIILFWIIEKIFNKPNFENFRDWVMCWADRR